MSTIIGNPIMLGGGGGISAPIIGKDFNWTGGDGAYQVLDDGDKNWRIKFLSSGTFTPLKNMTIDVFCVGGGGSGGLSMGGSATNYLAAGTGGGGGYTTTSKSIVLTANTEYPVVIGAGGVGPTAINDSSESDGTNGGETSGFGVSAMGGYGGKKRGNTSYATTYRGGNGGSGGGGCDKNRGYNGGSDGSDGFCGSYDTKGIGQGTTTREFGESTGDLYAGGGGAGAGTTSSQPGAGGAGGGGSGCGAGTNLSTTSPNPSINGEENTGGGGGGNHILQVSGGISHDYMSAGNGGSGIVIIRKHKEAAV